MDRYTEVQIEFTLTPAEVRRAMVTVVWRRFWFFALFPLLGVAGLFAASVPDPLALLLAACSIPVSTLVFLPLWQARAVWKSDLNLRSVLRYRFWDGGIDCAGKAVTVHYDWEMAHSVLETSEAVLVYITRRSMLLTPKRALTDEHLAALRAILRTHVKGRIRLRG